MSLISLAYEGHPITIRDDGWFNATEAAKPYGKRPIDWLNLPETVRYVAALAARSKVKESHFAQTRRGGRPGEAGTWLHPKLAVRFAQWLNIDFSLWCDEQIESIIKQRTVQAESEYLPTYHALHERVDDLAASSQNKKFVHINLNKLINNTVGIESGQRHGLPLPRKSLLIVAQAAATHAMEPAKDHHDGYQLAKAAMGTLRPVAQQLAGQSSLRLN